MSVSVINTLQGRPAGVMHSCLWVTFYFVTLLLYDQRVHLAHLLQLPVLNVFSFRAVFFGRTIKRCHEYSYLWAALCWGWLGPLTGCTKGRTVYILMQLHKQKGSAVNLNGTRKSLCVLLMEQFTRKSKEQDMHEHAHSNPIVWYIYWLLLDQSLHCFHSCYLYWTRLTWPFLP